MDASYLQQQVSNILAEASKTYRLLAEMSDLELRTICCVVSALIRKSYSLQEKSLSEKQIQEDWNPLHEMEAQISVYLFKKGLSGLEAVDIATKCVSLLFSRDEEIEEEDPVLFHQLYPNLYLDDDDDYEEEFRQHNIGADGYEKDVIDESLMQLILFEFSDGDFSFRGKS